jgi:hypothetical protein
MIDEAGLEAAKEIFHRFLVVLAVDATRSAAVWAEAVTLGSIGTPFRSASIQSSTAAAFVRGRVFAGVR